MKEQIIALEQIFDKLNQLKFNNELKKPIVTIQSKGRMKCFGWCSNITFWKNNKEEEFYEINIVAEYLNREFSEICETMLHEMVHLHNSQNNIKDCSKNHHNKHFKEKAEEVGLIVEKDSKVGFGITHLSSKLEKEINSWEDFNKEVFNIYRMEVSNNKTTKQKSKFYNYSCPTCGSKVKSLNDNLEIICKKCGTLFEIK